MSRSNCMECNTVFHYKQSQSTGKYCSNKCQQDWQYENMTVPMIERGEVSVRKTLKKYLSKTRGNACENCNGTEWLGVAMPLEMDHQDGNAGNNLPTNLRLICPNCHALQPTSKGGNRGKGRKARGLPTN